MHGVTFFGIVVYQGFETPIAAASGLTPMPKPSETYLGGHERLAVGCDDQTHEFLVTWLGNGWLMLDPLRLPHHPHLASDFWPIRAVATKKERIKEVLGGAIAPFLLASYVL